MKDFVKEEIKESTVQHQEDLLLAQKGWFKFTPHMGVGILDYMNSTSRKDLIYNIRRDMIADGMKVNNIKINNETIQIDANY